LSKKEMQALKVQTFAVSVLAAIAIMASALSAAPAARAGTTSETDLVTVAHLRSEVSESRSLAVNRGLWLGLIVPHSSAERSTYNVPFLRWLLATWQGRASAYGSELAGRAGVYRALMCIHSHEGSWTALGWGGPYYGGLQMDRSFMVHYGAEYVNRFGDARHWPPPLQVAVAYRAVRAVGFSPWPWSAYACGV
jgi:hypothetical protein